MIVSPNTEILKYYKMFSLKNPSLTILIRGVLEGEHFVVF
jgi:hypothetical protein